MSKSQATHTHKGHPRDTRRKSRKEAPGASNPGVFLVWLYTLWESLKGFFTPGLPEVQESEGGDPTVEDQPWIVISWMPEHEWLERQLRIPGLSEEEREVYEDRQGDLVELEIDARDRGDLFTPRVSPSGKVTRPTSYADPIKIVGRTVVPVDGPVRPGEGPDTLEIVVLDHVQRFPGSRMTIVGPGVAYRMNRRDRRIAAAKGRRKLRALVREARSMPRISRTLVAPADGPLERVSRDLYGMRAVRRSRTRRLKRNTRIRNHDLCVHIDWPHTLEHTEITHHAFKARLGV